MDARPRALVQFSIEWLLICPKGQRASVNPGYSAALWRIPSPVDRKSHMHDQQIAAIDAWIAMQDAEISRPEAIRRLVELGLKAKK